MASLIPGYEYDIFISYRQKDNKGDHWVSEFVEALKTELESTFKEEISVYFDINSHDGLLENHDVDASLKGKLKCLIFIPIISRTYCDPKSFAWEHEFKAFVELASNDQFGLKVKMPNGNVANRVLPIRIHDLDTEDLKQFETVLGAVLRGIEFVYREPGVNKPLSKSDSRYSIQVNKVANAIKEIISGFKKGTQEEIELKPNITKSGSLKIRKKTIISVAIVIGLFIAGISIVPRLLKPQEIMETSIAVLPFRNDSPEKGNDYIVNGLFDEIINNLQRIKSFSRVLPRTSVEKYRNSVLSEPEIAKELNINFLLSGTAQIIGKNLKLNVILSDAREDKIIKSYPFETKISAPENIIRIYGDIAQSVAHELEADVTPKEKQIIERPSTMNISAYTNYQRGNEELSSFELYTYDKQNLFNAGTLFKMAIQEDPDFVEANVGLAKVLLNKHDYQEYANSDIMDSVRLLLDRAVSLNKNSDRAHICLGNYYNKIGLKEQALKEYDYALEINPNSWEVYFAKGEYYYTVDNQKCIENYHMAASLNHGKEYPGILYKISLGYGTAGFIEEANHYNSKLIKSAKDSLNYLFFAGAYEKDRGNYNESIKILSKPYQMIPDYSELLRFLGENYFYLGQFQESFFYFNKCYELSARDGKIDDNIYRFLGYASRMVGKNKESESYFKKALEKTEARLGLIKAENHQFDYRLYFDLASIYAFMGEKSKSYEYLRVFSIAQSIPLWMVTMLKNDPMFSSIKNEPEFKRISNEVEIKYMDEHQRIRKWLEENKMLE